MQLVWYHGTTNDALKKIQQEGVLFGVRNTPSRCTYLAAELSTAKQYGDVILTREAPVGSVGRFTTDDKNIFLGQRLFHYRPDPEKLDWNYLSLKKISTF